MSHPKCKDCKHFGDVANDWDNPLTLGSCGMVAESWEMSDWDATYKENSIKNFFLGHLASVSDGSAYRAGLNVSPDFYCAMHSDILPDLNPYSRYNR